MQQENHTITSLFQIRKEDLKDTILLAYPIIIAQVGIVLMGVADTIQVGDIGAAPLAAAGVANGIFILVTILGIGMLSVVSPLVATAKSQGEKEQCALLFTNSLRVGLVSGLMIILVLMFLASNFYIFKQKPEVEFLAIEYLIIIAVSALPMLLFVAARNFTDGLSFTKVSMYVTFLGVFLNIFLNWTLIHGKFGLPRMGLNGAGYATLITRTFMILAILIYIFKSNRIRNYLFNFSIWNYHHAITIKILQLGIPAGLQYFFEVAAFVGAAVIVGWLGVFPLAAHHIAINLSTITYMAALGLSTAGSIRIGDAQGEGSKEKTLRYANAAFLIATLFMSFACLIFIVFNQLLVSLYIDDLNVSTIAKTLVIIAGFFQLSDGIQCVALGTLRGLQDVNMPTVFTLLAYWGIGIPMGYLLTFYLNWGVYGMWVGLLVGLAVSALLLTTRFYLLVGNRKYKMISKE